MPASRKPVPDRPPTRREFIKTLAGAGLGATASVRAQTPGAGAETITYKTVDGLDIHADVWGGGAGRKKPVVIWMHGGALIMGSRSGVPGALRSRWLELGYVVVSIDYRLAPETKLPEIVADVRDAFQWVRQHGADRCGMDPDRIAAAGASAGGYLTLMAGAHVEPRPRALASFWGYGDITTPWYAEPDAFYRKQPLVPREEALASVGRMPLTSPPPQSRRGQFYLYCRQQGRWPVEVSGHDPRREPDWFDRYCPIRNVSKEYPPTILVHGTEDTDVPYSESWKMAARLKEAGVERELVTVEGGGHGLGGSPPQVVEDANARAVAFLRAWL